MFMALSLWQSHCESSSDECTAVPRYPYETSFASSVGQCWTSFIYFFLLVWTIVWTLCLHLHLCLAFVDVFLGFFSLTVSTLAVVNCHNKVIGRIYTDKSCSSITLLVVHEIYSHDVGGSRYIGCEELRQWQVLWWLTTGMNDEWRLTTQHDDMKLHQCSCVVFLIYSLESEATCTLVVFCVNLLKMSGIKRIVPRLTSMAFKMKFQDLVSEIKPVRHRILLLV